MSVQLYAPTAKELAWLAKNKLQASSVPGVQSWYYNPHNQYVHNPKTSEVCASREFTVYTYTQNRCDLVFESHRYDQRNGKELYEVAFRVDIETSIEDAFVELEAKIKRFPDKEIYKLFNSVFVDKNF